MNERIANYIEKHGPALLSAIMILIAGFFVSRWLGKLAMRWLSRKELQLEPPVRMLIVRLIRLLIFVFALVIAGQMVAALILDSTGAFGVDQISLSMSRVLGTALLLIGVILIQKQ